MKTLLVLTVAVGSTGCAANGAFELLLDLPEAPVDGSDLYVLVQPRAADSAGFEEDWRGDDVEAILLTPGERTQDHISVMSTDPDADLAVKVRFCVSPTCTDFRDDAEPRERWLVFEHPFYIGKRTRWEVSAPETPLIVDIPNTRDTVPTVIDRCQIMGCVSGKLSSYCRGSSGEHLCE